MVIICFYKILSGRTRNWAVYEILHDRTQLISFERITILLLRLLSRKYDILFRYYEIIPRTYVLMSQTYESYKKYHHRKAQNNKYVELKACTVTTVSSRNPTSVSLPFVVSSFSDTLVRSSSRGGGKSAIFFCWPFSLMGWIVKVFFQQCFFRQWCE